jgi:hypothetical protein
VGSHRHSLCAVGVVSHPLRCVIITSVMTNTTSEEKQQEGTPNNATVVVPSSTNAAADHHQVDIAPTIAASPSSPPTIQVEASTSSSPPSTPNAYVDQLVIHFDPTDTATATIPTTTSNSDIAGSTSDTSKGPVKEVEVSLIDTEPFVGHSSLYL